MTISALKNAEMKNVDDKFTCVEHLIDQLPLPIVLLGDFNAHCTKWGCAKNDSKGKTISDLLLQRNVTLLNDGSATYLHPGSGAQSAIDLSICDPSLYLDLFWRVHHDLCGSDHFPIIINSNKALPTETRCSWKLSKADWTTFSERAALELNRVNVFDTEDPVSRFTETLISIASDTIPKNKSKIKRKDTIWFNDECKEATRNRSKVEVLMHLY